MAPILLLESMKSFPVSLVIKNSANQALQAPILDFVIFSFVVVKFLKSNKKV